MVGHFLVTVINGFALSAAIHVQPTQNVFDIPAIPSFSDFITAFGRNFTKGMDEYADRKTIYDKRVAAIRSQNSRGDLKWFAVVNKFSDRTESELKSSLGYNSGLAARSKAIDLQRVREHVDLTSPILSKIDWNSNDNPAGKHLTTVLAMDQGGCGSCWAFAATGMLNARNEYAGFGTNVFFSPQELVDCVSNTKECGGAGGCDGATVELALDYVEKVGGLTKFHKNSAYPYTQMDGVCGNDYARKYLMARRTVADGPGNPASGLSWTRLPQNEAAPLMRALVEGPVAVSIALGGDFQMYGGGIFGRSGECNGAWVVNHAVVMVGYGGDVDDKSAYWKIQNSWGQGWGENGFIRLARDSTDAETANCGVDTSPGDGIDCKPYYKSVKVCGTCGILYDSVVADVPKMASMQ